MIRRIIYTSLTVLWMIVIFTMSSQTAEISGGQSSIIAKIITEIFINNPSTDLVEIFETIIRKLCHFFEYAFLFVLIYNTIKSYGVKDKHKLYSFLIVIMYAISDEIHQYFVPGRACRIIDVIIDISGAFFSYAIIRIFHKNE